MPGCAKCDLRLGHVIARCARLLPLFFLLPAGAAMGFVVERAEIERHENGYRLSGDLKFVFSEEALKALRHGVALRIELEAKARRSRTWLWDKVMREIVFRYRLEYHPLSEQYLVTDLDTGIGHHFESLPRALQFIGAVRERDVFDFGVVPREDGHAIWLRARLNTAVLPTPLRWSTYVTRDWRLSSPWFPCEFTP